MHYFGIIYNIDFVLLNPIIVKILKMKFLFISLVSNFILITIDNTFKYN